MRKAFLSKRNFLVLRFVAGVFLASRLWVAFFVYLGHWQRPFLEPIPGGWIGVPNWWLNPWTTYDSLHFMGIASHGYRAVTSNFFPLYPLFLKLAGNNEIVVAAWGILLSNAALALGLYYLYRLTRLDFRGRMARITVMALAFFPATAFFSAVYTESLFLLLIVAAFYCVRVQRWGWVIIWAALAGLTRNSGPLIALMLLLEYYQAKRQGIKLPRLAWFAPLAPFMTFAAFQGFLAIQFGSLLPGVHAQKSFGRHLSWPWTPIYLDLINLFPNGNVYPSVPVNLAVAILVFVLVWRYRKKFPPSYLLFVMGINLMNLCYSTARWPHTVSSARFEMSTFPFTQMLAAGVQSLWKRRLSRMLIMAIYLFICAIMCWLFGIKSFIG